MMFFTPGIATLFAMPRPCGTSASIVTFTFVTPSSARTISVACDSICSLTGHAGVVSTMRNETLPPSIFEIADKAKRDNVLSQIGIDDLSEANSKRFLLIIDSLCNMLIENVL